MTAHERDETALVQGVLAMRGMRDHGQRALAGYLDRLADELLRGESGGRPAARGNRRRAGAWWRTLFELPATVSALYAQERAWRLRRRRDSGRVHCLVALSFSRLSYDLRLDDFRAQLRELARPLPGSAGSDHVATALAADPVLCVFDPNLGHSHQPHRPRLEATDAVVFDLRFLLFHARWRLLPATIRAFHLQRRHPTLRFRELLVGLLCQHSYRRLLSPLGRLTAFFFTSNSHATEMLRVHLLQDAACTGLHEFLHGIPSTEVTEYFETILTRFPGAAAKHGFTAQIPGLPLAPVFASAGRNRAVNAYVNRYLREHGLDRPPTETRTVIERKLRDLLPALAGPGRPLLIAFTGGNSHDADYFSSRALRVECRLIEIIRDNLRASATPYLIVYTPHPRHDPADFRNLPAFSAGDVVLHRETILTWLAADLCLSLVSSALFEATYLGVKTFTPLVARDEIYDASLLGLLAHPLKSDTAAALRDFLAANLVPPAGDLVERAMQRLKLLS